MPEPHRLSIRVYWEDTDAGGVVYHASYLKFMERGRTELLRARGIGQNALQNESGLVFVVSGMNIKFRAPARLDDELAVETALKKRGGASLTLSQKIVRGGETLAEAEIVCALLGPNGRPARIPADLASKLSP